MPDSIQLDSPFTISSIAIRCNHRAHGMHGVKTNENEMENIQVVYEHISENEEGDEQYG